MSEKWYVALYDVSMQSIFMHAYKVERKCEAGSLDLKKVGIISPLLNLKKCQSSTVLRGSFWNWSHIMSYYSRKDLHFSIFFTDKKIAVIQIYEIRKYTILPILFAYVLLYLTNIKK